MLEKRKTADVVVIIMTAMVAVTIVIVTIAIVAAKLWHPEANVTRATEIVANVVTTTVGALVGFVGGRAQGKMEANGNYPSEYNT